MCHRYTSAQNSRHVDRKLFKMWELRGAGEVTVDYVPTDDNPADLFTKILSRQPFEKHRKTVLNLPGDTGMEYGTRVRMSARAPPRPKGRAPRPSVMGGGRREVGAAGGRPREGRCACEDPKIMHV